MIRQELEKTSSTETAERLANGSYAVAAHHLSWSAGQFVDQDTRLDRSPIAYSFSELKYGHLPSVASFSYEIAHVALNSETFLTFIKKASQENRHVFITAPGIQNIPSASNLLLKETVTQLNLGLTELGLPPLVAVPLIRLGEVDPNYCQLATDQRGASQDNFKPYIPEVFSGHDVIFIDDVLISGTTAEKSKRQIVDETHAHDLMYLFGVIIDPQTVAEIGGQVERMLNTLAVDESISSLTRIFQEGCSPTSKMIRLLLEEKNQADFTRIFTELTLPQLFEVYQLACQNHYQVIYGGRCAASLALLRAYLIELGVIDQAGLRIINRQTEL